MGENDSDGGGIDETSSDSDESILIEDKNQVTVRMRSGVVHQVWFIARDPRRDWVYGHKYGEDPEGEVSGRDIVLRAEQIESIESKKIASPPEEKVRVHYSGDIDIETDVLLDAHKGFLLDTEYPSVEKEVQQVLAKLVTETHSIS